jgi:hypothetical protein
MHKPLRLSLAATHALLCAQILDFTPQFPISSALQHYIAFLSPWFLGLGIPLLLTYTKPKVPGQYDVILAWAAGAIFISIYRECGIFGAWEWMKDGKLNVEEGRCGNAVGAEVLLAGLSAVMIWRRAW